jgi:hypothetical protein
MWRLSLPPPTSLLSLSLSLSSHHATPTTEELMLAVFSVVSAPRLSKESQLWTWVNSELSRRREPVESSPWVDSELSEWDERLQLVSSARHQAAEASSQRLVWDGRQPARTWARKQRDVRRWGPLPSNASEDCEESSLVMQFWVRRLWVSLQANSNGIESAGR